jgi:hypothetical protein
MTVGNEHRGAYLFGIVAQHDRAGSTTVEYRRVTSQQCSFCAVDAHSIRANRGA